MESLQVIVRVRPPLDGEKDKEDIIDIADNSLSVSTEKHKINVSYDKVLAPSASQEDVFDAILPNVKAVISGINCTIFAYGQTGTGKTFTMLGDDLKQEHRPQDEDGELDDCESSEAKINHPAKWGIIPRSIDLLFRELNKGGVEGVVHCSYMQIYNDNLFDLLQDHKMKFPLKIREAKNKKISSTYVQGLSEFRVSNFSDILRLLEKGNRSRVIKSTEYNEVSSRSHAILQLAVKCEDNNGDTTIVRQAKFNLVDLAGSEKWNTHIKISSKRQKELTNINNSLSNLGNVIQALGEHKRRHIPYRNSKLTRLLQDSLGGNTRTTVICTMASTAAWLDESVSTLQFADRAKMVMTKVRTNEIVDDSVLLIRAQAEIARLKRLLRKKGGGDKETIDQLQSEIQLLRVANKQLKAQVLQLKRQLSKHNKSKRPLVSLGASLASEVEASDEDDEGDDDEPAAGPGVSEVTAALKEQLNSKQFVLQSRIEKALDSAMADCQEQLTAETEQLSQLSSERQQLESLLEEAKQRLKLAYQEEQLSAEQMQQQYDSLVQTTTSPSPEHDDDSDDEDELEEKTEPDTTAPVTETLSIQVPATDAEVPQAVKESPDLPVAESGELKLLFSVEDVGLVLNLYQFRVDSWYKVKVIDYDPDSGMHRVNYSDQSKQWHQMLGRTYKVESRDEERQRKKAAVKRISRKQNEKQKRLSSALVDKAILASYGPKTPKTLLHHKKMKQRLREQQQRERSKLPAMSNNDHGDEQLDVLGSLKSQGLSYSTIES